MHNSTPGDFWLSALTLLLPPVAALLSATALWVAARARSISQDGRSISQVAEQRSSEVLRSLDVNGCLPDALDQRKSSTKETTSTSPGKTYPRGY